jgi:uncharacterized membrane protein YfhO
LLSLLAFSNCKKDCQTKTEITKDDNESIEIQAAADQDAILLLSDTYYPGWKATIDGKKTAIFPANIMYRAIKFPKGKHVVRFYYDSSYVRWGIILSIIGHLVIVLLVLYPYLSSFYKRRSIE